MLCICNYLKCRKHLRDCKHPTLNNLPTCNEIKELQTDYNNMLTAIIDLLDGAKYLWE